MYETNATKKTKCSGQTETKSKVKKKEPTEKESTKWSAQKIFFAPLQSEFFVCAFSLASEIATKWNKGEKQQRASTFTFE